MDCQYSDCAPVDGCHNIVLPRPMNSCCRDVCQACVYNNRTIPSGQTILATEDPCKSYQCHVSLLFLVCFNNYSYMVNFFDDFVPE